MFEKNLCARFGELGLEDVVEEFMRVRQEGSVGKYQDKFEEPRVRMDTLMLGLEEPYFLPVFIGGLRDDIRLMVKMLKPKTLSQT